MGDNHPDTVVESPPWKRSYPAAELEDVACPACSARQPRDLATEFGITISRCLRCGLVYTRTPLPDSQGHYGGSLEGALAKYGEVFRGEAPHPRDPNYVEHLETIERLTPPSHLLDVGSHAGFFLRRARERGWQVVGVEPSAVSAQLAREQFGLDVHNATLEDAGLPAASFDVVTMVDVFEHVARPLSLLREVARVLRPGGLLFIKVPNARYVLAKHRLLRRVPRAVDDVFDAREHLVYYTRSTLARMLGASGFRVEELLVPSPIQTGGRLRRLVRGSGPALARRLPLGAGLPIATDVVGLARKP